jgi:hypothetical protein
MLKDPSLLVMVPKVVFWQKTDAPTSGVVPVESVILPAVVNSCANREPQQHVKKTNNRCFIIGEFDLTKTTGYNC